MDHLEQLVVLEYLIKVSAVIDLVCYIANIDAVVIVILGNGVEIDENLFSGDIVVDESLFDVDEDELGLEDDDDDDEGDEQ